MAASEFGRSRAAETRSPTILPAGYCAPFLCFISRLALAISWARAAANFWLWRNFRSYLQAIHKLLELPVENVAFVFPSCYGAEVVSLDHSREVAVVLNGASGLSLPERFRRGDEDALAELGAALCPAIGRRLARRYPLISRDRADHLALCALMCAWEARSQFDPSRGTFEAWLWRIALREAAHYLASPAGQACSFESAMDPAELIQACDHCVAARGEARPGIRGLRLTRLVRRAVRALPPHYRYVLLADTADNGSVASSALARELGVQASTIRCWRKRAKAMLEKELRRLGAEKLLRSETP